MPVWLIMVLSLPLWALAIWFAFFYGPRHAKQLEAEHQQNLKDIAQIQREMTKLLKP